MCCFAGMLPIRAGSSTSPVQVYMYNGVNINKIYFSLEDAAKWKESFTNYPLMVEAIDQFYSENEGKDEEELEESIRNLLEDLAYIFYHSCYVELE